MYSYRDRPMGMQVHAVPEAERAFDSSGRRLPWGYEYANPHVEVDRSDPVEKGPFGRSMRRSRSGVSRSRSKTAEPRKEEDRIRAENMAAEDAVFGSLRRVGPKDDGKRDAHGENETHGSAAQAVKAAAALTGEKEPTEVLLYGFGNDMQWAAIDFYERVSDGCILEDYDRQAPGSRYDISRSLGRAAAQKSLSRAAMRKKNKYAGGEHWIKITFDSQQAAELATARQPHIIKGYLVYAEPYTGSGPQRDEPIFATQAGAQITSDTLPPTLSTDVPQPSGSPNSSTTVTSATATAPSTTRQRVPWGTQDNFSPSNSSNTLTNAPQRSSLAQASSHVASVTPSQVQQQQQAAVASRNRLRVEGATRAVVLPAELAFAPRAAKPSWTTWFGGGEIIGAAVPRREDGAFDWARASLYWRLFYWLDTLLGTDFCGLRGDD